MVSARLLSCCVLSYFASAITITVLSKGSTHALPFPERQFKEKWATLKHVPVPTKPKSKPPSFMPVESIWLFILLSIMYWSVVLTAYHNIPGGE